MNIDWTSLGAAVALVMVLEGLSPFLNPRGFRRTLVLAASMSDRALRILGLLSMLLGLAVLYAVH